MRKILVLEQFMDEGHREIIRAAAEKTGFAVDFSTADALTADQAAEYEIVYGLPKPAQLKDMTALRWFCASFAGVDNYVDEGLYAHPGVLLTNSAGAYGVTIAEHVMMVTLLLLRQYPLYAHSMARRQWHAPVPMGSIYGSRVTVLGTGDIGSNVARRFRAMGAAHLCGVRRSGKPAPDFDETLPFTALDDALPRTDILVMALPGTAETAGILSRERLALLPKNAIVVNVGRGTAIDQDALVAALTAGAIAGAALDVMVPEPLPQDSPLWTAPNLILTPHCAGNFSVAVTRDRDVALFCEDLERYAKGLPLLRLVDRKLGY